MTTLEGAHNSITKNSPFSSCSLLVKSVQDEIQLSDIHMDTTRGYNFEQL